LKHGKLYIAFLIAAAGFLFASCENIFAPSLDTSSSGQILSDQKTIEGVFTNFKYAYSYKDTSVYSALLTDDFLFTYTDYEIGFDVSWDKPTDMRTTSRLFDNSQKTEVIWNNITVMIGDSLNMSVKRSFNLTITFNPSNIVRLYGFADMNLTRPTSDSPWKIKRWRDQSF
jgi:hypothetical protein